VPQSTNDRMIMSHPAPTLTWDIFCNVIDNYGDIGIAWRLARQLRHEHDQRIRLWVDDLSSFARMCPALDSACPLQMLDGIEVRVWPDPFPEGIEPAEVILDAFGCQLPDSFVAAMAAKQPAPLWINLEYLSAEAWVEGCHGMVSPHPRLPLKRHFFFPGFSQGTGGVIAEQGLDARVRAWQQDSAVQNAFWETLGVPARQPHERRISLFSYENPDIGELLHCWASGTQPVRCLVPEGRILADITAGFSQRALEAGDTIEQGALTLHVIPFTDQDRYDRLLWSCDFNFVRGEDSFMRAQWARRPFIWHIYPQRDSAHWVKLEAFWQRYTLGLSPAARQSVLAANHAWNHEQGISASWKLLESHLPELQTFAAHWPHTLLAHGDLASRLLRFIEQPR
jgi:uncharacterized repeat protein (TIGR03837 family)